ncbi:hypothetical protein FRB95_008116 [Tulasnella sp. JGI-2019a]|nr:hypothetical protein FRB95_008116 [Tulasnella sp. JGI-2019a]
MTARLTHDQISMLIRSTSSVLHEVKPQVIPSSATSPFVSRLDRIALLFVTKGKGKVVAMTADETRPSLQFETVPSNKNLTCQSRDLKPDVSHQTNLTPGPGWMSTYLQDDLPAASLRDHAAQLAYLIQQLRPLTPEGAAQAMTNLKRYAYFQCLSKIEERLSTPVPGLKGAKFESVFARLSDEAVRQEWTTPGSTLPKNIERRDEAWLVTIFLNQARKARADITREHIPRKIAPKGGEQLEFSAWSASLAFIVLQTTLRGIRASIGALKSLKRGRKEPEDVKKLVLEVEEHLDLLSQHMSTSVLANAP